jgi:hypothetical protein
MRDLQVFSTEDAAPMHWRVYETMMGARSVDSCGLVVAMSALSSWKMRTIIVWVSIVSVAYTGIYAAVELSVESDVRR